MTDRYALFGNPVSHSRSPVVQAEFAQKTMQDMVYTANLIDIGCFDTEADIFFSNGGKGLNITSPFKLEAFRYADTFSEASRLSGTANILKSMPDGSIFAHSADGDAIVKDITVNLGWTIRGKSVLLVGAGGAIQAILWRILKENPSEITIANRSIDRVKNLIKWYNYPNNVNDKINIHQKFDLIINGVSQDNKIFFKNVLYEHISRDTKIYDMNYGSTANFLHIAKSVGLKNIADGSGMLLEQAKESFFVWRGIRV